MEDSGQEDSTRNEIKIKMKKVNQIIQLKNKIKAQDKYSKNKIYLIKIIIIRKIKRKRLFQFHLKKINKMNKT